MAAGRLFWTLALIAAPAHAELRDLCPERPGLDTPPCILDKGHIQIETGLADLSRDVTAGAKSTTIAIGEAELRYGLDEKTEIRASWTAYIGQREFDRTSGQHSRDSGIGDVTIGLKRSLRRPDGNELSLALLPSVTLPAAKDSIGDGDWSASLQLPFSYALSDGLSLIATPEIDAAADADGHGRHLAYGSAGGLSVDLSDRINASVEMQVIRERDPEAPSTKALGGVAIAYKSGAATQFDAGANIGLNRATPDAEVYFGISRRF